MSDTLIEEEMPKPLAAPRLAAKKRPAITPLSLLDTGARNMFGMDYRSLGLMRICTGLILMWVAYSHGREMRMLYTDAGVLPRIQAFQNPGEFLGFSLHFANGSVPYIATLFILQFIFATMMMLGYRTRLATIASYIFLLSMQNRHSILIYGADIVLRVCLFWMMFLPLARRFSLDALIGRLPPPPAHGKPWLGVAGIALIVQFSSVYVAGALMKVGPTWQVDHDAVAYALSLDVYTRSMGKWLNQYPTLTHALTIFTIHMETYGPLLFILPIFSKWARMLGIFLFAGLQIGFAVCMMLGYFGPVMIVVTLSLLPAIFWDRIAGPIGKKLAAKFRRISLPGLAWPVSLFRNWVLRERARNALRTPLIPAAIAWWSRLSFAIARDLVVAYLIVIVVLWNVRNLPEQQPEWFNRRVIVPARQAAYKHINNPLIYTLGINQTWDMFSPNPQTIDGWFVVMGTMHNGQTVDLMSGISPATLDKPASVCGSYQTQLDMSYLISFWTEGASDPELFAIYMGNQWNKRHTGDERLQSVEINMMLERVEPGPTKSETWRQIVWTQPF